MVSKQSIGEDREIPIDTNLNYYDRVGAVNNICEKVRKFIGEIKTIFKKLVNLEDRALQIIQTKTQRRNVIIKVMMGSP